MEALSLQGRFSNAMNTVEENYYYYASKLVTPSAIEIPKAENIGPLRSHFTDWCNIGIHHLQDTAINAVVGFSPSPSEKDLASAIYDTASAYAPRLPSMITQFTRSPAAIVGAVAVCGAAIACNPAVREEISHGFKKAGQQVADAGSYITTKVAEAITPSIPIAAAIAPQYRPEFMRA